MNCPADGVLRAWMDGELSAAAVEEFGLHRDSCAGCRGRLDDLRAAAEEVGANLRSLAPAPVPGFHLAENYTRLRQRAADHQPGAAERLASWLAVRRVSAGGALAAGLALAVLFSAAPARSWGERVLDMLRVHKVAVVPIDMMALGGDREGAQTAGKLLSQMISDSMVVTMKPGAPQPMPDVPAAGRLAGFAVRAPLGLGTPRAIAVEDETAFHLTLSRDRMQDLLEEVGRSDIQIPASADGSTVAVHIPKSVRLSYGSCSGSQAQTGSAACIAFYAVPSPVVSVPPTLNLPALAEAGLQVAGMSAAEAHEFCRTVDWSSTLLIPVPRRGSSSRVVSVDGAEGTLIETAPTGRSPGEYALIWAKDGMLYSLQGSGSADRALAAAQSLD